MKSCYSVVCALTSMSACIWAGDGAPNLLAHPSFEGPSESWRTHGRARYAIADGLGRGRGACLRYGKERDDAGPKENSHHDQVVEVEPNAVYVAGAWFRAEGDLRPVLRVASIQWDTLALAVSTPSREWQQVRTVVCTEGQTQVRFQVFGGSLGELRESAVGTSYCDDAFLRRATDEELGRMRRCKVSVDAESVLRKINPLFFGVNALFMVEDDASRADGKIAKYLREMPCRFLRYPGGEMADNYHWKTHRLDDPKIWPCVQGPHTMDTDEFMGWCREIGAEPIFVVNLESGFTHGDPDAGVREAAEWVTYCNKQKSYNVRYWEIGNETYLHKAGPRALTARQYAEVFCQFSRAMKAVDPAIRIGAIGPQYVNYVAPIEREGDGPPWWPTIVDTAGADMDFAIIHHYHRVATYNHFAWSPLNVSASVAGLRQFLRQRLPDRNVPIALTEWNSSPAKDPDLRMRGMANALMVAELIGNYITGGVDYANFWPLRFAGNTWHGHALLDVKTNEPHAPYHVMKLFASNIGARQVEAKSSNVQIYVFASLSEDGKELAVFLVNKSVWAENMEAKLVLDGFTPKVAHAIALTAPAPMSEKLDVQNPRVVAAGETWACRLPRHSITLIKLRQQGPIQWP